nr:hypothetical protein [Actinomadura flavalba]
MRRSAGRRRRTTSGTRAAGRAWGRRGWFDQGRRHDLFDESDGLASWLAEHGFADVPGALPPLLAARDAIRAALERGQDAALDDVLSHGSRRPVLRAGTPAQTLLLDAPHWEAAWTAAADLVHLHTARPERIRACAHPDCILWSSTRRRTAAAAGARWTSAATAPRRPGSPERIAPDEARFQTPRSGALMSPVPGTPSARA